MARGQDGGTARRDTGGLRVPRSLQWIHHGNRKWLVSAYDITQTGAEWVWNTSGRHTGQVMTHYGKHLAEAKGKSQPTLVATSNRCKTLECGEENLHIITSKTFRKSLQFFLLHADSHKTHNQILHHLTQPAKAITASQM